MTVLGEHKGDGIRYAMHLSAPKGGSAQMLRDPDGGWVSWEDYARLKADVERLRKAGDALSLILEAYNRCKPYDGPLTRQCLGDWNAAKEGKPSV